MLPVKFYKSLRILILRLVGADGRQLKYIWFIFGPSIHSKTKNSKQIPYKAN